MKILIVIIILYTIFYLPPLLYHKLGWFKFFYHDLLKWHELDYDKGCTLKGINKHATCKHCGKEIIQDSQGNWFEV